jgi:hypothetical protein
LYEEVYHKCTTEFRILFEEELVKVMENSAGHEDALIDANNREKENKHYWLRFDDLMYEQRAGTTEKLLTLEKTKYIFAEALMKELCIQYAFLDTDAELILLERTRVRDAVKIEHTFKWH